MRVYPYHRFGYPQALLVGRYRYLSFRVCLQEKPRDAHSFVFFFVVWLLFDDFQKKKTLTETAEGLVLTAKESSR